MRPPTEIPEDYPRDVWTPTVRPRSVAELEATAREVAGIAEPVAAYLLAWLWTTRGTDPRIP